MLRDIIIQMQRAIIQKQLMDPLFKWGLSALGTAFTSAPALGPTGMNYPSTVANPAGAGGSSASIVVNVNKSGSEASVAAGGASGVELGRYVEAACNEWAIKNSRQGGLLART